MNQAPLTPKHPDGVLRVLVIGRVSTVHQNASNIEAGYEYSQRCLSEHYHYKDAIIVKHLGEQGSGMLTERKTILDAVDEIETGNWDVVLMEDVSKPYRNPRWIYAFIQDAFDAGCRVIAPGDCLDTADENWEVTLGAAALRHGLHIPDTRRRVRRTATQSFHRGGMVQKVRFGYRKLSREEAETGQVGPKGLRIAKQPEKTPVIHQMRDRVLRGDSYEELAYWLNENGIAAGPYVRDGLWTGKIVIALLRDPILSGHRTFRVIHEPVFRTGKHRRRKNPDGPETEHWPELAHLTDEEHQALLRVMDERKPKNSRDKSANHPLANKPRQRAYWPMQHPRCGRCGRLMYSYDRDYLKCANAARSGKTPCWNHVQVAVGLIRQRVLEWLVNYGQHCPEFLGRLVTSAQTERDAELQRASRRHSAESQEIAAQKKRAANLTRAIALGGELETLVSELSRVEQWLKKSEKRQCPTLPPMLSREEIESHLDQVLLEVAESSYEFANFMRRIVPRFDIVPVQALDTPQIRPRAKLTLDLSVLAIHSAEPGAKTGQETVEETIDLFEPPLHILWHARCAAEKAAHPKQSTKAIADRFGLNPMTVKRALSYARLMAEQGVSDPYRELTDCPASASRWKSSGKRAG